MIGKLKGLGFLGTGAVLAILAAAVLLTGCPAASSGPTGGVKGFAKGVITAKGSIFVNGIEYDTSGSQVTVDNMSGGASDLKVGMTVSLKGTIDASTGEGTADAIEYAKSLEGTVDSVDVANNLFVVFGITVRVDPSTVYEGIAGLAALAPSDLVEVSGTASGTDILASRVEKRSILEDFNLKGAVSGLGAASFTLTTRAGVAFTVNFTGTLDPAITNGSQVEVEFTAAPVAGSLTTTAARISVESGLTPDDGDRAEVSGIVTNFVAGATSTFTVEGTSISASSSLVAGVADAMEVEVHGTMNGGVLEASEVHVEQDADSELEGPASSVNASAGSFALGGVTVTVNASTIFRDEDWSGHLPVDLFGLADISVNDHLQVEAYVDNATVVAAKIERSDPATPDALLKGKVTAIATDAVTVMGQTIDTTGFTFAGGEIAFWATLVVGDVVKVTGTSSGGVITWSAIEIDD